MLWTRIRVVVTYLQKLLFENHFKAEALICESILVDSRVVVIVKDVEYPLLLVEQSLAKWLPIFRALSRICNLRLARVRIRDKVLAALHNWSLILPSYSHASTHLLDLLVFLLCILSLFRC